MCYEMSAVLGAAGRLVLHKHVCGAWRDRPNLVSSAKPCLRGCWQVLLRLKE